ncbi:UNVERIFIED_CONTAM: hypothetical protein FKN15_040245 [Acipenser sinensis]
MLSMPAEGTVVCGLNTDNGSQVHSNTNTVRQQSFRQLACFVLEGQAEGTPERYLIGKRHQEQQQQPPQRPAPRWEQHEHPAPRRGCWDEYFQLVEALSWCLLCVLGCLQLGREEGGPEGGWEAYLSALEAENLCSACEERGGAKTNCTFLWLEEDCLRLLSSLPGEDYMIVPYLPPEGDYPLLLPPPPWEDYLPLPTLPTREDYLPLPPPPPEQLKLPPPPEGEELQLIRPAPPAVACSAPPAFARPTPPGAAMPTSPRAAEPATPRATTPAPPSAAEPALHGAAEPASPGDACSPATWGC